MKKMILLSTLIIFACSQNVQRTFNFNYTVIIESSNGKKIELWIPIPQSSTVQFIEKLEVNSDGLDYSFKKEKFYGTQ